LLLQSITAATMLRAGFAWREVEELVLGGAVGTDEQAKRRAEFGGIESHRSESRTEPRMFGPVRMRS
jgi:hypothetical protein